MAAHLVHHQVRHESLDVARQGLRSRRVDAGDFLEDLRRTAIVRLVPVFQDQVDDRLVPERAAEMVQAPEERCLQEAIAIFHGRRLGQDDEETTIGEGEQVEHVQRRAGPQIEQHHIGGEGHQHAQEPGLLEVLQAFDIEAVARAADQGQARRAGLGNDRLDRLEASLDEIAQGQRGRVEAEDGVQVRRPQVAVDQDHPASHLGEVDAEARRDQGLPGAALAAADRPDLGTALMCRGEVVHVSFQVRRGRSPRN